MSKGWIGVDLDGTLAEYHGWKGLDHIGDPIPRMVDRVKRWIDEGHEVKIFTARISDGPDNREQRDHAETIRIIQDWTEKHIGHRLEVTNVKDFAMITLWDDRAVRVEHNTGKVVWE